MVDMKLWHVVADDCEAYVVDKTAKAACRQIGHPEAEVREQLPGRLTTEGGQPIFSIPVGQLIVLPDEPVVLFWQEGG